MHLFVWPLRSPCQIFPKVFGEESDRTGRKSSTLG